MNNYNNNNQYSSISNFGSCSNFSAVNNPITYSINDTIDPYFLHGDNFLNHGGQHSPQSQWFLSDYCAQGWDDYCELASKNVQSRFPNDMDMFKTSPPDLTAGDILIRNTASRKYLVKMIAGKKVFEPFDPTVAESPMISKWIWDSYNNPNVHMRPVYAVDPATIDDDIVMDKLLMNPSIAKDILLNIYNTMKSQGTLHKLKNTKLDIFFKSNKHVFK